MDLLNLHFMDLLLYSRERKEQYKCSVYCTDSLCEGFRTKVKSDEIPSVLELEVDRIRIENASEKLFTLDYVDKSNTRTFELIIEGILIDEKNDTGKAVFVTVDRVQLLSCNNRNREESDWIILDCSLSLLYHARVKVVERDEDCTISELTPEIIDGLNIIT